MVTPDLEHHRKYVLSSQQVLHILVLSYQQVLYIQCFWKIFNMVNESTDGNTNSVSLSASAVAFKAPPFCNQDPSLWFTILECNFKSSKITNSLTKFTHAVSLLPPDIISQVSDVIAAAITSEKPYEDLKATITQRLESSITTRLQELLSREELGNERPTDLLRRMKRLLGDKFQQFDKAMFLELFYQRLPPAIQRNLFTVKNKLNIDELAELADEFLQSVPGDQITSVSTSNSVSQTPTPQSNQLIEMISRLTVQLNSLQNQVNSLQTQVTNMSQVSRRSRSHSRNYQRHHVRSPSTSRNGMCYYHKKFGAKAQKCDHPCKFNHPSLNSNGEH